MTSQIINRWLITYNILCNINLYFHANLTRIVTYVVEAGHGQGDTHNTLYLKQNFEMFPYNIVTLKYPIIVQNILNI